MTLRDLNLLISERDPRMAQRVRRPFLIEQLRLGSGKLLFLKVTALARKRRPYPLALRAELFLVLLNPTPQQVDHELAERHLESLVTLLHLRGLGTRKFDDAVF